MSGLNLPETYSPAFHGDAESHPYLRNLEYRALGKTGMKVSQVGYGTGFCGQYGAFDREAGLSAIRQGLKWGINYIDSSPWYGCSEEFLGEALKGIPRNVYYIGTKAGRNFTPTWEGRFDFSGPAVLKSVERSLSRLGLEYLDIIQIHDVEFANDPDQIVNETLPALESVVKAGKAKFIGITAYDVNVLKYIAERAHVDTVLTYCKHNLNDTSFLDFLPFFKEKGIGIINASPVSLGLFTPNGPQPWHPASDETKSLARDAAALAKERGTSIEKVSCRFSMKPKDPAIATTLVGMPTTDILKMNLDLVTEPLSPKDEELFEEIRTNVFGGKNHHWDGVEVKEMKEVLQGEA